VDTTTQSPMAREDIFILQTIGHFYLGLTSEIRLYSVLSSQRHGEPSAEGGTPRDDS